MNYLDLLKQQFSNRIDFREKRSGVAQLIAPFYHEDGDMLDIFLQPAPNNDGKIRISDHGMTVMRLSYSFDLDSPNKEKIFGRIIGENSIQEEGGNLFIDAKPESLYPAVLQFAQGLAKVSSMRVLKREIIEDLFYDMLREHIETKFSKYHPTPATTPIPDRFDLEVDFQFDIKPKPIYLFGVKDVSKARLVTISCLEFLRSNLPFKSFIVHKDSESLSKKDRMRITSASDKQFTSLDDFKEHGEKFIEREVA